MKGLFKSILWIMNVLKVIGMVCLGLVMIIVTVGVVSRLLGKPLLGSIEMAEIAHFIAVIFAFAYTQSQKEHISIDILVDRFSPKVQKIFDGIAQVLTIAVTMLISYVFFSVSMESTETTLLLDFPFTVLKIILGIGFVVWGFVSICQIPFKGNEPSLSKRLESENGTLHSERLTYHSEKEVKIDV